MTKLTEQQLTKQLKSLKTIKPNKDWAALLRSQIVANHQESPVVIKAEKANFFGSVFSPRSLVYSCAVLLLLVLSFAGYVSFNRSPSVAQLDLNSQAALTNQDPIKSDIAALKVNIESLTQAKKDGDQEKIPSAVSLISQKASQLAQNIKALPVEDKDSLNEIAVSLKVLADINGTDVASSPEITDLYKTVVETQIADFRKTTLSNEQTLSVNEAERLYSIGEYTDALELLLLINK